MLLILLCFGGYYFKNATVYDPAVGDFRQGIHLLLAEEGTVRLLTDSPITSSEDAETIEDALLTPHLSDFYSLVQERGLGFDQDVDEDTQLQMVRYYRRMGIQRVRDPIYPPAGLGYSMNELMEVFAQRGYVALANSPGAEISMIMDPEKPPKALLDELATSGPVTLWWTSFGTGEPLQWTQHPQSVNALIEACHREKRKIGAFIQDASAADVALLAEFPFDFYEGLPDGQPDMTTLPKGAIWVPLASLNDKRYCARDMETQLTRLEGLGLYQDSLLKRAQRTAPDVRERIAQRCQVWRTRRAEALKPLRDWLADERPVALGSSGGHMFAFSGDIASELAILRESGASQKQLMAATFQNTTTLLAPHLPFLQVGKQANFIVWKKGGYWYKRLGEPVSMNFVDGKDVLAIDLGLNQK